MPDRFTESQKSPFQTTKKRGAPQEPVNQRRHERYGMRFPVTLHFDDGLVVQGLSEDVSLSGFFVALDKPCAMELDRLARGTIVLGKDSYTFHCRISRVIPQGIGVTLNQDYAMLGLAITNYVFQELSKVSLRP
ncbi:MAG: PilZ domain-containing protein [Magnetococcus sp. YQC-9]